MNDLMRFFIPLLSIIASGAMAYGQLTSNVERLNKDMQRQEVVRDDVIAIRKDVDHINEGLKDINEEEKAIRSLLKSIDLKLKWLKS